MSDEFNIDDIRLEHNKVLQNDIEHFERKLNELTKQEQKIKEELRIKSRAQIKMDLINYGFTIVAEKWQKNEPVAICVVGAHWFEKSVFNIFQRIGTIDWNVFELYHDTWLDIKHELCNKGFDVSLLYNHNGISEYIKLIVIKLYK